MNLNHGMSAMWIAGGVYCMALSLVQTLRLPSDGKAALVMGLMGVVFGVATWQS